MDIKKKRILDVWDEVNDEMPDKDGEMVSQMAADGAGGSILIAEQPQKEIPGLR